MRFLFTMLYITVFVSIGNRIAFTQTLSQEQQQAAKNKIDQDTGQIDQITKDEDILNNQYQEALASKESQINQIEQEIYLLNSWLNPPADNSTNASLDTQGTVQI